jgi:hypothetical protein
MYRGPHMGQAQGGPHRSGGVEQVNKRPRWFVALFDYDPTTMSPNPDACEEELRFSGNDIIKVGHVYLLSNPILRTGAKNYNIIPNNSIFCYKIRIK